MGCSGGCLVRRELAAPGGVLAPLRGHLSPGLLAVAIRHSRHLSRDRHVVRRLQPGHVRLDELQHPPGADSAAAGQVEGAGREGRAEECGGRGHHHEDGAADANDTLQEGECDPARTQRRQSGQDQRTGQR